MIFRNKNLTLKLERTSEYEKPIVTPVGVIKDHYIADHYNACTAAYKTQGDFVSVATADSRMQQVLQRTHEMTPAGVRMISKLAYVQSYKVKKDVWAEIVEAHTKAPACAQIGAGSPEGAARNAKVNKGY